MPAISLFRTFPVSVNRLVVSIVFRTFVSQTQDLQSPGRGIFLSLIHSEGDVPLPCPVPEHRVVPCPYTSLSLLALKWLHHRVPTLFGREVHDRMQGGPFQTW